MEEIVFLELDDIMEIHKTVLKRYGGMKGIRDKNLLISAIHQPRHTFGGEFLYSSVPEMAAVYAYHLAENQPFFDGNKRTAFISSVVFLKLNRYSFYSDNEEVYQVFTDLGNKKIGKNDLILWYKNRCKYSSE